VSETLGTFTLDAAEGVLLPANGIIKTSTDPAPPVYDSSMAVGQVSRIVSVATFATMAQALAAALAYRAAIGSTVAFRGVACFVANAAPDHRELRGDGAGPGTATCEWSLVASPSWVPA
jgi:hypothetical protein